METKGLMAEHHRQDRESESMDQFNLKQDQPYCLCRQAPFAD